MNIEQIPTTDNNPEKGELSEIERKQLTSLWTDMIVSNEEAPENIADMPIEKLKAWLFESIMNDVEEFARELEIQVDNVLIASIKECSDPDEKTKLQMEYIVDIHSQIDKVVQEFEKSHHTNTRWQSWPKKMREEGNFNCVGATLLGMHLFKKCGLDSYCGIPKGHIVNIVQMANKEWRYIDLRNGMNGNFELDHEERDIGGNKVFSFDKPDIKYKSVTVTEDSNIVGPIFGNLAALKQESSTDSNAKSYYEEYSQHFKDIDYQALKERVYPTTHKEIEK